MTESRTRRVVPVAAALAAILAGATACGQDSSKAQSQEGGSGATRTVDTPKGRVQVPAEPKRIVMLTGGLAGYAFHLGAPVAATDTRVLGVTDLKGEFPPSFADAATKQGTTPLPGGQQLSIEAVAAAKPDLIIGGGQGISAVQAEQAYDDLSSIAPTVLVPTTATGWKDQLALVAQATGREAKAKELVATYDRRAAEVKKKITPPAGTTVVLLSLPNKEPSLVPPTAALPTLLKDVGFRPDDVVTKAGNPKMFGSGDSFNVSRELLPKVATAPNAFVVPLGGATLAQLQKDPVYKRLPAFTTKSVTELPATSYRPDYDAALQTLDLLEKAFG